MTQRRKNQIALIALAYLQGCKDQPPCHRGTAWADDLRRDLNSKIYPGVKLITREEFEEVIKYLVDNKYLYKIKWDYYGINLKARK